MPRPFVQNPKPGVQPPQAFNIIQAGCAVRSLGFGRDLAVSDVAVQSPRSYRRAYWRRGGRHTCPYSDEHPMWVM